MSLNETKSVGELVVRLALDASSFERVDGAELRLGSVRKYVGNPLLVEEGWGNPRRPYEARWDNVYPSVVRDPGSGKFRFWYNSFTADECCDETPWGKRVPGVGWGTKGRKRGILYGESPDGLTDWVKPDLGLVNHGGSTANNLVSETVEGGVFLDPEAGPEVRYKFFGRQTGENKRMMGMVSPDGLHWGERLYWPEHNPKADTHNNALRDPYRNRYLGFTRGWEDKLRLVLQTESTDFFHWSEPREILRGTGPMDDLYSMPVVAYAGGFIGLPAVLHGSPSTGEVPEDPLYNKVTTELAWSPDGENWHRILPGEQLIPLGSGNYPDGDRDCGCIYAAAPMVVAGEIRIYYGASNGRHNDWREGSLCLATLPLDGFAGYFSEAGGELETGLVTVNSDSVNVRGVVTAEEGSISWRMFDAEGRELLDSEKLVCEPGTGDWTWRGEALERMRGQSVRIAFRLRRAGLFSYTV